MNRILSLGEQLRALEQLQALDLQIDDLKRTQRSLPATLKSIEDSLSQLQDSAEVKKKQASELNQSQQQTRAALELNQERLTRAQAKLNEVQNTQEFQAATKEIDQLKKLDHALQEQALRLQEETTAIEMEWLVLDEQVQQLKKERDLQAAMLQGQNQQIQSDMTTLEVGRAQYLSQIEAKVLAQYNRVRIARKGLGIVPALGGRCRGCNMVVPPQLFNEIQRGISLHTCPSCHRILFVPIPSVPSPIELKT